MKKAKFALTTIFVGTYLLSQQWTSQDMSNAKAEASSFNSFISYKDTGNLNNKIYNPMAGSADVVTLDGSKRERANLTCQGATHPFVTITYSGVSDIAINVKIDTNGDGNIEKNLNFSGVSGIHSYGIVKCIANTYDNCSYYKWAFDSSSNTLYTTVVQYDEVYSPYCINNSCGSMSLVGRGRILDDLSGAIGGVIQQASSSMAITRSQTTATSVELYGQDYSTCTNNSSVQYSAGSAIPDTSVLQNQAASQAGPGNEGYDIVSGAITNNQNNPTSQADMQDMKEVAKSSFTHTSVDSSDPTQANYTLKYKDESGNWVTDSSSSSMAFDAQTQPESCMVTWEEANDKVYGDNTAGTNNGTVQTQKKEEIRTCTNNNTVCPVSTGETIKYDCGNLEQAMGESLAGMKMAQQMSEDLSCSSN